MEKVYCTHGSIILSGVRYYIKWFFFFFFVIPNVTYCSCISQYAGKISELKHPSLEKRFARVCLQKSTRSCVMQPWVNWNTIDHQRYNTQWNNGFYSIENTQFILIKLSSLSSGKMYDISIVINRAVTHANMHQQRQYGKKIVSLSSWLTSVWLSMKAVREV